MLSSLVIHTDTSSLRTGWYNTEVAQRYTRYLYPSEEAGMLAPISIVHETCGCLFVNKPPGLSFHRDEAMGDRGLLPLLRKMKEHDTDRRLFSVHRLDRVTSG